MTNQKNSKGPLRYRLYYRLMDISLIVKILAFILAFSLTALGWQDLDRYSPIFLGLVAIVVWPITYVVVPILIVVPHLRDEYAEVLWKRSIAQLMVVATTVPPLIFASIYFISAVLIQGDLDNWGGMRPDWLLDPLLKEVWVMGTTITIWSLFTTGFVVLFQWNRWRDSRDTG